MIEKIPAELIAFASLFEENRPLYIVGGFVRDYLVGGKQLDDDADIDICSALRVDELKENVEKMGWSVKDASERIGTVIVCGKERRYEYTTFRSDSYPNGCGVHRPISVQFVGSVEEDCLRRDFRCNAVYYDIRHDEIVDLLGGVSDIENKMLRTTRKSEQVFEEDGLRILRLFRFQSVLGYGIERKTYDTASRLVDRLDDISVERVQVELLKIVQGDYCQDAVRAMYESGVLAKICPWLSRSGGLVQNQKYHKYDVLEHSIRCMGYAPKHLRLVALLHDVGKTKCFLQYGNMYDHAKVGSDIVHEWMDKYKFSNKEKSLAIKLIEGHMFDLNNTAREVAVRKFVAKHIDILDDLVELMNADCKATVGDDKVQSAVGVRLLTTKDQMLNDGIAMQVKDLAIDGKDLVNMGIKGRAVGDMLDRMVDLSITQNKSYTKEQLVELATRWKE